MARLDTGWHEHPKVLRLWPDGMALHAWSISYCDAVRSDGFIASGSWPALRGVAGAVQKLVQAGVWEVTEGGYRLHDFDKYNRLRAQIEAEQAAGNERAKRSRQRTRNAVTDEASNAVTNAEPLARLGAPGPGPGPTGTVSTVNSLARAREPDVAAPRLAPLTRTQEDEPSSLRPEQQLCPMCPEVFPDNASLRDHLDNSPRHKVRPVAEDFSGKRSSSNAPSPDTTPPDIVAELAALVRPRLKPEDLPPDIAAEHERLLAQEQQRNGRKKAAADA